MASEFKLSYTGSQINAKLNKIDSLAAKSELPTKVSDLTNDYGFVTETYVKNYSQPLGNYALKSDIPEVPVQSVNGKTGIVNLNASDVGALPNTTTIPTVPTNVSAFTNDIGYLTEHQSLDGLATETYVDNQVAGKVDSLSDLGITATATELNYVDGVTSSVQTQLDGKASTGHNHIYYGVCDTTADTVEKTVTIDNFSLVIGAMVIIKFSESNSASSPTLNVNNTGAKPIYRYGTTAASTSTTTTGWRAGAVQIFVYDGTGWIRDFWENTTYSNVALGQGYATCSTAAATTAKVGTLSSYKLATGGIVSVKFTNAVPANATLNINSTGAKNIYYRGAKITSDVIKAGDVATFVYNSYYYLISIDRWQDDIVNIKSQISDITSTYAKKSEIPTSLKNPNALTFAGAVTGTYDGSSAKTITIPTIAGEKGEKGDTGAAGPTGPKGDAGKTPVKGTDYWTAEDKNEVVTDAVASVQAQATQQNPLFAETIEDCTDTSKVYVLPDGFIYGYIKGKEEPAVPLYTNWLPIATNPDGSIYDTDGYKENTRLSVSSGYFEERTESGWCATGLIPAKSGDVIRLKNCVWTKSTTAATHRGGVFGADASGEWVCNIGMGDITKDGSVWSPVYDSDGDNILQITIQSGWEGEYIRIVVQQLTKDSIITVNEEIVEGSVGGYTNQLPISIDADGNIYNVNGYKQYTRLSASGGYTESTSEKQFLTGFIPAKANDVIRFQNVTMPYGSDGTHEAEIYLCQDPTTALKVTSNPDAHELPSTWTVEYDSSNNITKIIVGSDYSGSYIRFNIGVINGESIITVNEEIVEGTVGGYTNLVSTAEAPDSTAVYNGVGYQHGYYISSSSGHKESINGTHSTATGLMPFKVGTYYIKGGRFPSDYTECRVTLYDSSKTILGQKILTEADGYFTVEELDTNYLKMTFTQGWGTNPVYFAIVLYDCTEAPVISTVDFVNMDSGDATYGWNNTGHAFVPVDYEDRVVAFERRVSSVASNVNTLTDRVEALESGATNNEELPDYWVSHLEARANDIRLAMENAGRNKSSFLWYTDAHWNYGSQMSPKLLSYLYQHTPINKVNFGGDIVNNEPTDISDRETMKYLWEWRDLTRELPNHHSVIGNHDDGNTTNKLFPESYIYAFLLAPEENNDIVIGDGFYYYMDDKPEKTRYLYLDTAYESYTDITDTQLAFVKDAIKTTPAGWHIVAIAHIWHNTDYTVTPPKVSGFCNAATKLLAMFDSYNARSGEYSACGGKVEFCIGGHCHSDNDSRSSGGIPVILTETDSMHVRSGLSYTAGTITESSVNGIIADYSNKKITVVRIGRGSSREVALT